MNSDQPKPTGEQEIILPCPFCGSDDVSVEPLVGGFVVDCKDCGSGCGTCHDEKAAIEQWNKRKSLAKILKERGLDSDKIASEIESKCRAAKIVGWLSQEALDEYSKVEAEHRELREQLAAEREKVKTLVDALEWYAEGLEPSKAIAALAKVKEGK